MKRLISSFMIALLCMTVFAACSSNNSSSNKSSNDSSNNSSSNGSSDNSPSSSTPSIPSGSSPQELIVGKWNLSHGVFYIFNANGTWRSEGPHMVISGTYAISSDYTLTFTVEGEDVSWIWEESDQRSSSGWYVTIDRLYLGNNTGHPRE